MAFGRHGLSIEEYDDYNMRRRLNWKVFKEAGRWNTVANCVSGGNAAHGSSASVVEVTKAIEQIFP
jgi:hypothetical protein